MARTVTDDDVSEQWRMYMEKKPMKKRAAIRTTMIIATDGLKDAYWYPGGAKPCPGCALTRDASSSSRDVIRISISTILIWVACAYLRSGCELCPRGIIVRENS